LKSENGISKRKVKSLNLLLFKVYGRGGANPEIDIVIRMMGGKNPGRTLSSSAMKCACTGTTCNRQM